MEIHAQQQALEILRTDLLKVTPDQVQKQQPELIQDRLQRIAEVRIPAHLLPIIRNHG